MRIWLGKKGDEPPDDAGARLTPEGFEIRLPEATDAIAVYPEGEVEYRRTRRLRIRADEIVVPIPPKTDSQPGEGPEG